MKMKKRKKKNDNYSQVKFNYVMDPMEWTQVFMNVLCNSYEDLSIYSSFICRILLMDTF